MRMHLPARPRSPDAGKTPGRRHPSPPAAGRDPVFIRHGRAPKGRMKI
jgi:hypothetical protein